MYMYVSMINECTESDKIHNARIQLYRCFEQIHLKLFTRIDVYSDPWYLIVVYQNSSLLITMYVLLVFRQWYYHINDNTVI